jgi:hypothetical protein
MAQFVLVKEPEEAMLKLNVDNIGDLAIVECEGRIVRRYFIMSAKRDTPRRSDRGSQISNELGRLFNQQTEFFRKGTRAAHTPTELAG